MLLSFNPDLSIKDGCTTSLDAIAMARQLGNREVIYALSAHQEKDQASKR